MTEIFTAGSLASHVSRAVERGHRTGALVPIATDLVVVHEGDLTFPVRILGHFRKKLHDPITHAPQGNTNPFLPYDPNLFVTGLSETHVCLLNKYPIVEGHLLMVTRQFEPQDSRLTRQDFDAAWRCLKEIDGVVFYNSGQVAGASQPHRHLQLIPTPLEEEAKTLPMARLFAQGLPFRAGYHPIHWTPGGVDAHCIETLYERYGRLLVELGLVPPGDDDGRPEPYNLLMTREFLMVVPRRSECIEGISINAMGFMGSLFVRDKAGLDKLLAHGVVRALRDAAGKPVK